MALIETCPLFRGSLIKRCPTTISFGEVYLVKVERKSILFLLIVQRISGRLRPIPGTERGLFPGVAGSDADHWPRPCQDDRRDKAGL